MKNLLVDVEADAENGMSDKLTEKKVLDQDTADFLLFPLHPGSKLAACLRTEGPGTVVSFGHMTNLLAAWSKILRRTKILS